MAGHPDADFIARRTTNVVLPDGTPILLRPIAPDDKERLIDGFQRLSERSRYLRFMSPMSRLSSAMLTYLTEIDYVDHYAVVAFAPEDRGSPGVGVGRYVRVPNEPDVAEAAVAVVDDFQGRGIGTLLLKALETVALHNGIRRFRAYVLGENRGAHAMFSDVAVDLGPSEGGIVQLEFDLVRAVEEMWDRPMHRALRAAARGEGPQFRPLQLDRADV